MYLNLVTTVKYPNLINLTPSHITQSHPSRTNEPTNVLGFRLSNTHLRTTYHQRPPQFDILKEHIGTWGEHRPSQRHRREHV